MKGNAINEIDATEVIALIFLRLLAKITPEILVDDNWWKFNMT